MKRYLLRHSGQFIPISAIVMFTMAVFMVAVVNVYKIARTKLKVQNLADAAALNLASQAQAYNVVADRNEWLNHMTAGIPSPSDMNAPANIRDCSFFDMSQPRDKVIPPIACAENNIDVRADDGKAVFQRKIWDARGDPRTAKDGAIGYAMLVHTVNQAQKMFVKAYNSFLGDSHAGPASGSSTNGPSNFEGLLKKDIPALDNPKIKLIAWNDGDLSHTDALEASQQSEGNFNSTRMKGLKFKVHHDLQTRYLVDRGDDGPVEATTYGNLLFGRINYSDEELRNGPLYGHPFEDVGWMVPDEHSMPRLSVTDEGVTSDQIGVGVFVSEDVDVPVIGKLVVGARAKAYVVNASGEVGDKGGVPVFRPTYWIKLGS